ncbi:hypothetical protein ACWD6I_16445 [Streptomyces sp. NPDC002454]
MSKTRAALQQLRRMVRKKGPGEVGPAEPEPAAPADPVPYTGPDDRSHSPTMERIRPIVEEENRRARWGVYR